MNPINPNRLSGQKLKIALVDPLLGLNPHYVPTGLCYLSAFLKRELASKVEVRIMSLPLRNMDRLFNYEPDLIGLSTLTHNFNLVRQMAVKIKQVREKALLVLGGQHITMAPWSMPGEFDCAILGEGEAAFLKLVQSLLSESIPDKATLPGLQYRDNGKLTAIPRLSLIEPLDDIPFPDRDSVENIDSIIILESYKRFNKSGLRSMQVTTSRGCPYMCKFCQPSIMWEKFRLHSPEYIAEEISHIVSRYGINAVHFEDDLFVCNKNRIATLIDQLGKKNLLNKIVYYAAARTRQIDQEWVTLLKTLGVVKIEFGIESGADAVAQYLKSGATSNEITKSTIRLLNQAGITVYASFIAGSPPESSADLEQTWKLIKWIKNNHIHNSCAISIATPLPGTPLWEYAVQQAIINPQDINWEKLNTLARFPKNESEYFQLNTRIKPRKLLRKVRLINTLMWLGTPAEFIVALPRRVMKVPFKLISFLRQVWS